MDLNLIDLKILLNRKKRKTNAICKIISHFNPRRRLTNKDERYCL